jgi:hypothetical protein
VGKLVALHQKRANRYFCPMDTIGQPAFVGTWLVQGPHGQDVVLYRRFDGCLIKLLAEISSSSFSFSCFSFFCDFRGHFWMIFDLLDWLCCSLDFGVF